MTETPNPYIVDADTLTGEMRPIRKAVLAIGSNLGDRLANLQGAVSSIADTPDLWIQAVSPVYETAGIGTPEGSDEFLNAVVVLDTALNGQMLLDRAHAIEDTFGRERSELNAPRTLDIDLIVLGETASQTDPVLPHPRAGERRFVLEPWHDVEPDAILPGHGPIADLLAKVSDQSVRRRDDLTLREE
jgi:2-amino-4-hydroxy-6-hydroxymethyldihydropteridine diphosphokinase